MWLATKHASKRPPRKRKPDPDEFTGPPIAPMLQRQNQLGLEGAIEYRKLYEKLFDVDPESATRGPDEGIQEHFDRLKNMDRNPPTPVSAEDEEEVPSIAKPLESAKPTKSWATDLPPAPEPAAPPTDLKGMPQRIPGWFTGDAMDKPPRDFIPGAGPLPERNPGRSFGWSPYDGPMPRYQPPQQSHDDWVKSLADKGIYLNPDGTRVAPAAPPPRPRGYDIWSEFTRPAETVGRHRAAKVVTAYITRVLESELG